MLKGALIVSYRADSLAANAAYGDQMAVLVEQSLTMTVSRRRAAVGVAGRVISRLNASGIISSLISGAIIGRRITWPIIRRLLTGDNACGERSGSGAGYDASGY